MPVSLMSDLSKLSLSRSLFTRADSNISRLNVELATGRLQNLGGKRFEHSTEITQLKQRFTTIEAYQTVGLDAERYFDTVEVNLEGISDKVDQLAQQLLTSSQALSSSVGQTAGELARETFKGILSHLNASVSGQPVFGRQDQQSNAYPEIDLLLRDVQSAASGALGQVLDTYFPHGIAISGNGVRFQINEGVEVANYVFSDDPAITNILRAVATVINSVEQQSDPKTLKEDFKTGAETLLTLQKNLTELRGKNGVNSGLIEQAKARLTSEQTSLNLRYNSLTAANPYDTATQLQSAQSMLERLYVLTARMEKLSFVEYMK